MFSNCEEPTYTEIKKKRFESAKRKAIVLNTRIEQFLNDLNKSFLSSKEKNEVLKHLKFNK